MQKSKILILKDDYPKYRWFPEISELDISLFLNMKV